MIIKKRRGDGLFLLTIWNRGRMFRPNYVIYVIFYALNAIYNLSAVFG